MFKLDIAESLAPLKREMFFNYSNDTHRNVFKTAENMKSYGSCILLNELCQPVKTVQITIHGRSKMAKQGDGAWRQKAERWP